MFRTANPPHINLEEITWKPALFGGLQAEISVSGVRHWLQALPAVITDEEREWAQEDGREPKPEIADAKVWDALVLLAGDVPRDTVEIQGKPYFLIMTPEAG